MWVAVCKGSINIAAVLSRRTLGYIVGISMIRKLHA